MDKLQPIIKQRFWILLGLSLILAFFAFFKNQAAIVAATTAKEQALKASLDGVPKGTEANQSYVDGLTKINTAYKSKIDQAVDELFAGQQQRMTWPDQIAKELPRDPKGIPLYRDKDKPLGTVATRTYEKIYKDQLIEELWKKAEPVVERAVPVTATPMGGAVDHLNRLRSLQTRTVRPRGNQRTNKLLKGQTILYGQQGFPPVTWKEKVYIDRQAVPQKVLSQIPSAEQVWDCQEDIWFTELLFEAVRKLNKDADNVLTSPLKVISKIQLHGGAGAGAIVDPNAMMAGEMSADSSGMEPETMAAGYGALGMGGIGGMGATGVPGAPLTPPPTEFDPAEVFGPEATAAAAPTDGGGETDASGEMTMGMGMGMMAMPQALRWVELTDGAKFRQRGFYMQVIINQQKIPDFLVHLCESAWPTKILKFQLGPNPYRTEVGAGAMGAMYGTGFDMAGAGYGGDLGSGGGFAGGSFGGMSRSSAMQALGMTGMEDMGMGMGGYGGMMSTLSRYQGGPPAFARTPRDPFNGSLNQPDLVQLDVAGIITFYVSAAAAAETTAAESVDTPSAPGGDQAILDEAAKQVEEAKKSAEAQKGAATDGTAPMPATTPATGTAPATTPPATGTPAPTPMPPATPEGTAPATTTPPAATTPPATPPVATPEVTPPAAAPQTPAAPGT